MPTSANWLAKRRTMTEILADIDLQTDEKQVARIRADMQDKALGSRYIDLSNEQVFLRRNDRVSARTWKLWCEGIKAFLSRPAFVRAWAEFKDKSPDTFKELRRLEREEFKIDPYEWGKSRVI